MSKLPLIPQSLLSPHAILLLFNIQLLVNLSPDKTTFGNEVASIHNFFIFLTNSLKLKKTRFPSYKRTTHSWITKLAKVLPPCTHLNIAGLMWFPIELTTSIYVKRESYLRVSSTKYLGERVRPLTLRVKIGFTDLYHLNGGKSL